MRSWAYNCFGVLMGTSGRASGPRWPSVRADSWPMITLFLSQGDFCATAYLPLSRHSERMQQSQGNDLAGPEMGLGVFGDGTQLLIDFIEQGGDKLYGHHTALLASQGCHASQRGRVVGRLQAQKLNIGINSSINIEWFVRD